MGRIIIGSVILLNVVIIFQSVCKLPFKLPQFPLNNHSVSTELVWMKKHGEHDVQSVFFWALSWPLTPRGIQQLGSTT